jgi:hypothetical protein
MRLPLRLADNDFARAIVKKIVVFEKFGPIQMSFLAKAQLEIAFLSQALIIERAVSSASSRVPKTVLSFGNLLAIG